MDDKSHCPLQRSRDSKLVPPTIQSEQEHERRRVRAREQSNAVSSTPDRGVAASRRCNDEVSGVPCKVPRFQYVDFPSLHQCIQQLSVPPLESWLTSCRMGRPPPGVSSTSPKERAPKFKYVDYPSLYHCIQQLSVPPLESWSSALPQPSDGSRTVVGSPSQAIAVTEDQGTQTAPINMSDTADEQQGSLALALVSGDLAECSSPGPNTLTNKRQDTAPPPRIPSSTGSKTGLLKGSLDQSPPLSASPGYYSKQKVCPDPDRTSARLGSKGIRPSVISLHPGKGTLLQRTQGQPAGYPDSLQVAKSTHSETVCPLCQKMLAGPEELREHQEHH